MWLCIILTQKNTKITRFPRFLGKFSTFANSRNQAFFLLSVNYKANPFCTSSISTSMNTVSVKKTSNIQVVEIQITLQDGHHLVNYNEIHENLQAFVSWDKRGFG